MVMTIRTFRRLTTALCTECSLKDEEMLMLCLLGRCRSCEQCPSFFLFQLACLPFFPFAPSIVYNWPPSLGSRSDIPVSFQLQLYRGHS